MKRYLILALLLPTISYADETITQVSTPEDKRPFIRVADSDYDFGRYYSLMGAKIFWHLEPSVPLPKEALTVGTRIRVSGERIEILGLGRYAMTVAQEEFVVEFTGNRPDKVLTSGQCKVLEAMGSDSYFVRDAVAKSLREAGVREIRLLVWAKASLDREIRYRGEMLLSRLGWER